MSLSTSVVSADKPAKASAGSDDRDRLVQSIVCTGIPVHVHRTHRSSCAGVVLPSGVKVVDGNAVATAGADAEDASDASWVREAVDVEDGVAPRVKLAVGDSVRLPVGVGLTDGSCTTYPASKTCGGCAGSKSVISRKKSANNRE